MTIKQYSDLQRLIGVLEGMSVAITGESEKGFYIDTVGTLSESIEEVWSGGNAEDTATKEQNKELCDLFDRQRRLVLQIAEEDGEGYYTERTNELLDLISYASRRFVEPLRFNKTED